MFLTDLHPNNARALTFTLGNSVFGIDVSNILSFSDSYAEIRYASQRTDGFVGYLDFRDTLVQVFECATSLSQSRERDRVTHLISDIQTFRLAHIEWLNALEDSIISGKPFTKPRSHRICDFGKWLYSLKEKDDEQFRPLFAKLEQPHMHIHSLADKLLDLAAAGEQDRAIAELHFEKKTTFKKLLRALDNIKSYLNNSIHPVVLHLTKDGHSPWFSLVLDGLSDMVEYSPDSLDTLNPADQDLPVKGYVRNKTGENFMLLSLERFYAQISAKLSLTG